MRVAVDLVLALWLKQLRGLGGIGAVRVAERFSPEELCDLARNGSDKAWHEHFGNIERNRPDEQALQHTLQAWLATGICILSFWDADYPERLGTLEDAPLLLFLAGNVDILDRFAISVVGSRRPTPYGERMAQRIAGELADAGVVVASGHAPGIDCLSHYAALKHGGATAAFLGGSHDVIQQQNPRLYQAIVSHGVAVSEYPPGTESQHWMFPARNRLIAAQGQGTLVVEAQIKSGTMITARLSAQMGRDLFAVPGQADAAMAEGPLSLLRDGAGVATCAADILGAFWEWQPPSHPVEPRVAVPDKLKPLHRWLLSHPDVTADDVCDGLDLPLPDILMQLTELEILGAVAQNTHNRYRPLTAA